MSSNITPLHIMSAFQTEPAPLDFVFPGFLAGSVGALYSPGGVGKSFISLEISANVAGIDLLGFGPHSSGRTLYIALEDPVSVLQHRLHAIGHHLAPQQRELFAEKVDILPMIDVHFDLLNGRWTDWLTARAEGVRLIIIDTLSRAHSGDESSNGEMARLIGILGCVGANTGAAVLFLHHVNKGSGRNSNGDQFAIRGASALIDNARFAASLTSVKTDDIDAGYQIKYSISKHNFAAPIPDLYFSRHKGGVLLPAPAPVSRQPDDMPKPLSKSNPYLVAKNGGLHDW